MNSSTATEPATFYRRAGSSGLRLAWANVRNNWVLLVSIIVARGGYYYRNNGWSDTVTMLSWTIGGIVVILALGYGLYAQSTVRLTRDELIVTRFGVRQRLARDEVGDFVRSRPHTNPLSTSPAVHYWFITDVRGQRFVAVPQWSFPDNTFEDLADVLGVEARAAIGPEEEQRLAPWWMSNMLLATLSAAVVLVIVVSLATVSTIAVRNWMHTRAETSAQDALVAQVERQLTTERFPHLDQEAQGGSASPLFVSGYAETSSEVRLRSRVDLVGATPELSSAEAIELLDIQCAASTPDAEVTVVAVGYTSDDVLGYDRYVELDCAADPSDVHAWLTWSEQHPATQGAGAVTVTQETYDGEQSDLEIVGEAVDATDKALRATLEHVCAFPGADEAHVAVHDRDMERSIPHVRCDSIEAQLAE